MDETMLMGFPSVQEAKSFNQCLLDFGKASGLNTNGQKYQDFFFNMPSITR